MTDAQDQLPYAKQLNHLPVIANALQRLRVRHVVDELVPVDPRSKVTTGECVEALVTAILLGRHALYEIGQLLDPFDLQVAFGFRDVAEPHHFNDARLAKALDDLFDVGGVAKVNAAATAAAIAAYDLSVKQVHLDTTSVSVYGDYELSEEPDDPDDPQAIPHVTRGYSKDRRPDLKQVIYGVAVSGDGAVPVFGRVSSGNRADVQELRFTLNQIRDALPSPEEILFVGDSKLFCAETLALVEAHGLSYVTLLSKNFALWPKAYETFSADRSEAPVLKVKGDDPEAWDFHRWRGRSFETTYEFEWDSSSYSVPVRLLVVESDALRDRKVPVLERRQEKERVSLEKAKGRQEKRVYACEEDAQRAAARVRQEAPSLHKRTIAVRSEQQRVKRSKAGRPRNGEQHEFKTVWHLHVEFGPDDESFDRTLAEESCFVLVTNQQVAKGQSRADADRQLLRAYDDQDHVERSFRWTKHPLAVAPIFLKTPKRIAALGLVYVLAIMVYALIQRDARARLERAKTTMPGNKGWTAKPTTEVIFKLFYGIDVTYPQGDAGGPVVTRLDTEQVRILDLLGVDFIRNPRVQVAPPREPRPGDRSFKPRPRKTRKSKIASPRSQE